MQENDNPSATHRRTVLKTVGVGTVGTIGSFALAPSAAAVADASRQDGIRNATRQQAGPTIVLVTTGDHTGRFGAFEERDEIENQPGSEFELIFRVRNIDNDGIVRVLFNTAILANRTVLYRNTDYLERTMPTGTAFESWTTISSEGWEDGSYTAVVSVVDFLTAQSTTATSAFTVD